MFQWMTDFTESATRQFAQFNNSTFKDAAMAVCALVAASDGQIEPQEKSKVAALIQKNELLQCFDAASLRDTFLSFADKAADEFERIDLVAKVRRLKGNADQADACIKVGMIIANADGDLEAEEIKVIKELCRELGLVATNYVD